MLENNQLLLIVMGVLMMSRSPKQLISHILKDCLGLSKVIEVWSTHPDQPMSSASEQHADDFLSTSHDTVGKKKSRVKFPCML
jgi:hypothetical protein